MSGLTLSLTPYRLPLAKPLLVAGSRVPLREGLVLALADGDGHVGYGDVAPLPGLHDETLDDARAWLEQVKLPENGSLGPLRNSILRAGGAPPSAWFALEAAFLTLEAGRRNTTPASCLTETPLARVPVNALFDGDADEARAALDQGVFDGYASIKVKLARRDPAEDAEVLAVLDQGLPLETKLRLDANQGLTVESALAILDQVAPARVEYVEEPLAEAALLEAFHERTGLTVALDELLYSEDAAALVALPFVRTLVLKPALRGGLMETVADAERAREKGKQVVISSCFESGLGLSILAQLSAAVMDEGVAAGLATDHWLAEDTVEPAFDTSGGWVDVSTWAPTLKAEQHA